MEGIDHDYLGQQYEEYGRQRMLETREDSFDDLLKKANNEDQNNAARPRTQGGKRHRKQNDGSTIEAEDENLGEDFELSPWLPPSIEKAKEFKKNALFRNGDVRLDSVDIIHAPDLGVGVTLYFQFAMTMTISLLAMSFFAIPILVFVYNGNSITEENQDAFGLYRYTLGNIGFDKKSVYYKNHARCLSSSYAFNETCIHIGNNEFSLSEATNIITAMEFLQIVVFFVGVVYLYRQAFSLTGKTAKSEISISDYTVMVTDIPPDATDKEIIEHFTSLYKLDEPDFKGRPALEDARPVSKLVNGIHPMHLNTWVAECTIHKGIGGFISSFKSKQHVMEGLYRCRARMKMYAENSPHSHGHNLKLFLSAEQTMLKLATFIDKLTAENIKKTGLKFFPMESEEHGENHDAVTKFQRLVSNPNSVYYNIDAPAVAAFICFEYTESFARCLDDYQKYNSFPMSLLYPHDLKFRGEYKIKVRKAPEPDQIIWENIEIPLIEKIKKRISTTFITVCLVVLCFIIILQASIYKSLFSNKIPSRSLCQATVPELFSNRSSAINLEKVSFARPPANLIDAYDARCAQLIPNSFYAIYTKDGSFDNPVYDSNSARYYDFSACTEQTATQEGYAYGGICPAYKTHALLCPCVSTSSSVECKAADCFPDPDSSQCITFKAEVIGACYCYEALGDMISKNGVVDALSAIDTLKDSECGNFYTQYSLSTGLTYVSVLATTIVNVLLRMFLKILAKREARSSTDAEQGSIMTKIFLSNFVTMAVIVLVAYGKADNLPQVFKAVHIFNGPYPDFTVAWYGNMGFYLMSTFIIQSFSPLVANIMKYWFLQPILRFYHHGRVRAMKSHTIVMQHDLNMLEVGQVFDSTDHTAQLLTLLFFAMMYSPGLPLLMPLCCFAFTLYFRVDKYLLCRYYQKPPHIGDEAMRSVVSYLPYAAVIRLCFACWMYGNTDILITSSSVATKAYESFLEGLRNSDTGVSYARDKVFRTNVFPLFILLLAVMAGIFVNQFWKQLPIFWTYKLIMSIVSTISGKKDIFAKQTDDGVITAWDLIRLKDPNRHQSCPFTGEYFRFIKHKDEIPDTCIQMFEYAYLTQLTEVEIEEGWKTEDRRDFVVQIKVWMDDNQRRYDGSRPKRGDKKSTFEVIADHRCSSYDVERVPAYRMAIMGLREGTSSVLLDEENANLKLFEGKDMHLSVVESYEQHGKGLRKSFFNTRNSGKAGNSGKGNNSGKVDKTGDVELGETADLKLKVKPNAEFTDPKNLKIAVDTPHAAQPTPGTTKSGVRAPSTSTNDGKQGRNFTFDDFLSGNDALHETVSPAEDHQPHKKKKNKHK